MRAFLLFLALGATASAQVPLLGSQDAPAFSEQELFAAPTSDWLTNGGSQPLDSLNPGNVGALKANWRASLNGSGLNPRAGNQAQPIVYGDSLYVSTGDGDAFAIDLGSGAVKWEFQANVDPKVARACCRWPPQVPRIARISPRARTSIRPPVWCAMDRTDSGAPMGR